MKMEEPVMAAYVAESPKLTMDIDDIKVYCRKHLDKDFLLELEENDYFSSSPIPFDNMPQSESEWTQMEEEAEESGWVTCEEFFKHISAWRHA